MIRPATLALAALFPAGAIAQGADAVPRLAVVSAFQPEIDALLGALDGGEEQVIAGTTYRTGRLEGREVVVFLSGISMVNAAMTVQAAIDHFAVEGIVFSGIAGGVDPSLSIGDVVVAERWGQYLDVIAARETADGFAIPPWMASDFTPFGMFHTRNQTVARGGAEPETRFWFPADPGYLEVARTVAGAVTLEECGAEGACLTEAPEIVVGGSGVSGSAFVDNADLRDWAFGTFEARVLDMESAAVAQVAYANGVPFVAFRSLSDLAGGGEGANEMMTFLGLAAGNSAAVVRAFVAGLE